MGTEEEKGGEQGILFQQMSWLDKQPANKYARVLYTLSVHPSHPPPKVQAAADGGVRLGVEEPGAGERVRACGGGRARGGERSSIQVLGLTRVFLRF